MAALVKPAAKILAELEQAAGPPVGPACGTRQGYRHHYRANSPACEPCLNAENTRNRTRYRARSKAWHIRHWARAAGLTVEDRGLLPQPVIVAYRNAQAMAVLTPDDPDLPEEG